MADRYWSFDGENIAQHVTPEEARDRCQNALDRYETECALDEFWPEEVESIMWGPIAEIVESTPDDEGPDGEQGYRMLLEPVRVTKAGECVLAILRDLDADTLRDCYGINLDAVNEAPLDVAVAAYLREVSRER